MYKLIDSDKHIIPTVIALIMNTCRPINILKTLQSKSRDTTVFKLQGNLISEISLRLYDKEDLEKQKKKH